MKPDSIKKNIIQYIKTNKVITTSEISKQFKLSWNTAEKYLLELVIEHKIQKIKKIGVNLWVLV